MACVFPNSWNVFVVVAVAVGCNDPDAIFHTSREVMTECATHLVKVTSVCPAKNKDIPLKCLSQTLSAFSYRSTLRWHPMRTISDYCALHTQVMGLHRTGTQIWPLESSISGYHGWAWIFLYVACVCPYIRIYMQVNVGVIWYSNCILLFIKIYSDSSL